MKLQDVSRSGNILYLYYYDEENDKTVIITEILCLRHSVYTYYDLYEYSVKDSEVTDGTFAMVVILDAKDTEWYKKELCWGYHKNAVMLFAGMDKKTVDKLIKPFKAKKKVVDKKLKIIDFELFGRQMKLYLGKPDCNDYWGDDWNDVPYEHNAGTVYSEYVEDTVVVNFLNEEDDIQEVCSVYTNSPWCKEDFKKGAPFAYIENYDEETHPWHPYGRSSFVNNPNIQKFYYETPVGELYKKKYIITED